MENLFKTNIKLINFPYAKIFYNYGVEHFHLPVLEYCLKNLNFNGLYAEFGVWKGLSTNFIAKKINPEILYAFDSFEGLEVEWNGLNDSYFKVNDKDLHFESNVQICKGYFSNTIPEFLRKNRIPLCFINVDCDIYSSTKDVLFGLNNLIIPGTIIYFDELYNYFDYKEHEYKALKEWCEIYGREFKVIAFNMDKGIAIEVIK